MKRAIAILLGFLAFAAMGYVGGQAQNEQSESIRQLQSRIEQLERAQAAKADCACIRVPKGSNEIEIGGIYFYLVPVAGEAGKGGPK